MAFGIMLGIIVAFGGILVAAAGGLLHVIQPTMTVMITGGLCAIGGLYLTVFDFMSGGIGGVFARARMSGNSVGIIVRNDKRMKFVGTKMKDGLGENKFGQFLILPDTVYTTDAGATAWLGYHKYGVTLPVNFVRAAARLKEMGVRDIGEVHEINDKSRAKGEDRAVRLDARMEEYNQAVEEM